MQRSWRPRSEAPASTAAARRESGCHRARAIPLLGHDDLDATAFAPFGKGDAAQRRRGDSRFAPRADFAGLPSTSAAGSRTSVEKWVSLRVALLVACPYFPARHRRRHRTPVERTSVRCSCCGYDRGRTSGPVISDRCRDATSRALCAIRNMRATPHRHGYPGEDHLNRPALQRTTQMFCDHAANVRCAGLPCVEWISRHAYGDK